MVVHEAISVADPMITFIDAMKGGKEGVVVLIIPVNRFLIISPAGNMIDGAGVFYAKRTCHVGNIPWHAPYVKTKDLTP